MSRIRLILLTAVAISLFIGLPPTGMLNTGPGAAQEDPDPFNFAGLANQSGTAPDLLIFWKLSDLQGPVRITPVTGLLPGEKIGGIDFDNKALKLIGVTNLGNVVVIDPKNGVATKIASVSSNFTQGKLGVNFDPETGKFLIFGDNTLFAEIDLSRNPPLVNIDTKPDYASDDANAGKTPKINGVASGKLPGSADTRTFILDSEQDVLAEMQKNLKLKTIGALGINISAIAGFSALRGTPFSFAALQLEGEQQSRFYIIDLVKGAAVEIASSILIDTPVNGLAVLEPENEADITCEIDPDEAAKFVGTTHTFKVTVKDKSGTNINFFSAFATVLQGPNKDQGDKKLSREATEVSLSYTGSAAGVDIIQVIVSDHDGHLNSCGAKVTWVDFRVDKVEKSGKHLIVTGCCFQEGDKIVINDVEQKTKMDPDNPTSVLSAKKGFKKLEACEGGFKNRVFVRRLEPGKPIADTQAFATCP